MDPLNIVALEAENVKCLHAIRIQPDGSAVILGGDNAAGKSSVLDCIGAAIQGKKACPGEPVRHGTEAAKIVLDLGKIIVKRTFRASGTTTLVVENKDGSIFKSPQALLDGLYSHITIEPERLLNDVGARKALVEQVSGADLEAQQAERQRLYDERTAHNRETKRLRAHAESLEGRLSVPLDEVPGEELSVLKLMEEVDAISERNQDRAEVQRVRERRQEAHGLVARRLEGADMDILAAQKALKDTQEHKAQLVEMAREIVAEIEAWETLPELETTDHISAQLAQTETVNADVRTANEIIDAEGGAAESKTKAEACTEGIAEIDQAQSVAISGALDQVEDLTWRDGDLFFEDLPFDQRSTTEQLRLVMALAMAANPHLRVILVRNGSLLDERNLDTILAMAEAAGYQVWMERVGQDVHTTVHIEDGESTPVGPAPEAETADTGD